MRDNAQHSAGAIQSRCPDRAARCRALRQPTHLSCGGYTQSCASSGPDAYVRAREKYPDLVLELSKPVWTTFFVCVRRGDYSFVVGRSTPEDTLSVIKQTPFYPEVGVVVGRAGHPAAGRRHRKLQPLLSYPWVLPNFGPTRSAIDRAFMRAGCTPPSPSFINYATQLVCAVLCRSDALAVMPFGA
jgi:LysR family transcriptional regulator, regulator for genes of the gallate degradation pathway